MWWILVYSGAAFADYRAGNEKIDKKERRVEKKKKAKKEQRQTGGLSGELDAPSGPGPDHAASETYMRSQRTESPFRPCYALGVRQVSPSTRVQLAGVTGRPSWEERHAGDILGDQPPALDLGAGAVDFLSESLSFPSSPIQSTSLGRSAEYLDTNNDRNSATGTFSACSFCYRKLRPQNPFAHAPKTCVCCAGALGGTPK